MPNSLRLIAAPVRLIAAALFLAMSPARAAVDPGLLALTPPDARVLFGMHVQQALASPFGQFALSRMPDHGATLMQMAATTGFDPRRDLRELLLASSGRRGKTIRDGVMLARGTFQIDKLTAFAGAIHAKLSNYDSVTLITPAEPGASAIAILDNSTLAMGSEAALRGVINRYHQKFLFSGPLADKAQAASGNGDVWVATVTPLASILPANNGGPWPATFFQAVAESSAALRLDTGGVTLVAEALTRSPDEATGLAGLLKVVASMMPGSQSAILRTMHITTDGPAVRLELTVAEPDLEQAFPAPAVGRAAR